MINLNIKTESMTSIRAILFDADGVIQHNTDDLPERLERTLGYLPEPLGDFLQDVIEAERPALTNTADLSDTLTPVLRAWKASCTTSEFIAMWSSSIIVSSAILKLVNKLRMHGIYCAIASTQQRYRADYMSKTLGYHAWFDNEFYACHVGAAKPDTAYFEAVIAQLPFAPKETLFIDDQEENVRAAKRVGLYAAKFELAGVDHPGQAMQDLLQSYGLQLGC